MFNRYKYAAIIVAIITAAWLKIPGLVFFLGGILAMVAGILMLIYAFWLAILCAPIWLFIWWSWDTIVSYGLLGYWGILGAIIIPLLFGLDKNLRDHEYQYTSIGFMVWAAPPLMYGIYSYWNIAQWILGAMFFIGCIAFALSSNEEDSQESSETNSGDEEPWYNQYIEDKS